MKPKTQASIDSLDKIPPHNIDVEEIVLGQLLIDNEAFDSISDILKPESFYKESHQLIFDAMRTIYYANEPINLITVITKLKNQNTLDSVGGAYRVSELTQNVSTTAHIEHHAKIIKQSYIRREFIKSAYDIQNESYEIGNDVSSLIELAESTIYEISKDNVQNDIVSTQNLKQRIKDEIIIKGIRGFSVLIACLDRRFNGLRVCDLIIIAGRPSMGKTAFAIQLMLNIASQNIPVLFFSLEMGKVAISMRMVSCLSGYSKDYIENNDLSNYELDLINKAIDKFASYPIFIDDTPALSIYSMRSKIRRFKQKYGIKIVFLDYIQLCRGEEKQIGNKNDYIGSVSSMCKQCAKEFEIPFIALSQLNRGVEGRSDKIPTIADLRDSGNIEQDADIIMFPVRIKKIQLQSIKTNKGDVELNDNDAIIEIAKYRDGETGADILYVSNDCTQWKDKQQYEFENMNSNDFRFNGISKDFTESKTTEERPF